MRRTFLILPTLYKKEGRNNWQALERSSLPTPPSAIHKYSACKNKKKKMNAPSTIRCDCEIIPSLFFPVPHLISHLSRPESASKLVDLLKITRIGSDIFEFLNCKKRKCLKYFLTNHLAAKWHFCCKGSISVFL